MKPTVTIELSEYQNLLDFKNKCKTKKMFLFDENLNIVYFTDKDLNIIHYFNEYLDRKDDRINKLIDQLFKMKYRSFTQKLKNLFK